MAATIRFLVLSFSIILGFSGPSLAGDDRPTLGDDGLYHYNWYHQSFFELAYDLDEALASGKVLMVKFDQKAAFIVKKLPLKY